MCILGVGFQMIPGCPVALLANREESYARPSAGPRIEASSRDPIPWLGGIDLTAGGTWLGINAAGLTVAVTNRPRQLVPAEPRSRGWLCRSLMACASAVGAAAAGKQQLQASWFAGCNLLVADATSATVIEAGDELRETHLAPGLHFITNGPLDDPADRRIARVRDELTRRRIGSVAEWIEASKPVCGLQASGDQPAVCLAGVDRGTVSSTIVGLTTNPVDAQYWFAGGPPATTEYTDWSEQLRSLLAGRRGAVRHSIHLRGPWKYVPLAQAAEAQGLSGSTSPLPAPGTAQLPTTWGQLLGDNRGRVLLSRRFHGPTNLDPGEMVEVRIAGATHSGTVWLNGHTLGEIGGQSDWRSREVTALLSGNDEIRVALDFDSTAPDARQAPLWESLALVISDRA